MKEIKVLSLLNGQELVGSVYTDHTQKRYHISDPLLVIPQQGQNPNQMGFSFMPWPIFGNDDGYSVDFIHVVTAYTPRKEVLDGYENTVNQLNASKKGLVIPSKPRLIIE